MSSNGLCVRSALIVLVLSFHTSRFLALNSVISQTVCNANGQGIVVAVTQDTLKVLSTDLKELQRTTHSYKFGSSDPRNPEVIDLDNVNLDGDCFITLCSNSSRSSSTTGDSCDFFKYTVSTNTLIHYKQPKNFPWTPAKSQSWISQLVQSGSDVTIFSAFVADASSELATDCGTACAPYVTKLVVEPDDSRQTIDRKESWSGTDSVLKVSDKYPGPIDNVFSFSTDDNVYILRNKFRRYTPENNPNGEVRTWVIQLSRTCIADKSDDLKSRLDLSLTCSSNSSWPRSLNNNRNPRFGDSQIMIDNDGLFAVSAYYVDEKLFVYFETRDESLPTDRASGRICKFSLAAIERKFNEIIDSCRNSKYRNTLTRVFARKPASSAGQHGMDCAKIAKPDRDEVGSCSPSDRLRLYLYEGISAGQMLNGEPTLYWETRTKLFQFVVTRSDPMEGFGIFQNSDAKEYFLRKFISPIPGKPSVLDSAIVWEKPIGNQLMESDGRMPIGISVISVFGNNLYLANTTTTSSISVFSTTCRLYSTCEELALANSKGDVKCIWCISDDGKEQFAETPDACPSRQKLSTMCPPTIHKIIPSPTHEGTELEIVGKGFDARGVGITSLHICEPEIPCESAKTTFHGLTCVLHNKSEINKHDPSCQSLTILATLRNAETDSLQNLKIALPIRWLGNNVSADHLGGAGQIPSTVIWLGIASAIILCIIVTPLLICRFRRRQIKKRNKTRSQLPSRIETETLPRREPGDHEYRGDSRGLPLVVLGRNWVSVIDQVPTDLRVLPQDLDNLVQVAKGHFGVVYKGFYRPPNAVPVEVAVKALHPGTADPVNFIREGKMMNELNHPHVLGVIGISEDPNLGPLIVLPFMANGDLFRYLRDERNSPTVRDLLQFAIQVVRGMAYLSLQKIVHRDLACRNCMLDENCDVKIADFGLSRDVYESGAYVSLQGGELPCRWMAVESIRDNVFDEKTDVWSYGVLLWELMTRCEMPYGELGGRLIRGFLEDGGRLQQPECCPDRIFRIMLQCWDELPANRQTFAELAIFVPSEVAILERESAASNNYLDETYINCPKNDGYLRPNSDLANQAIVPSRNRESEFSGGSSAPLIRSSRPGSNDSSCPILGDAVTTV